MSLAGFHPIVARWFERRFGAPTEAQARGWAEIASGSDTLIMAPTGSGKTLAAFLAGLDGLARRALEGDAAFAEEKVRIVYVSPLKALGADVERNLQAPLRGIEETAVEMGRLLPPIKTALRTGDTTQSERAKLVRHPPHVLITTPESLYLMLTSERARATLTGCETVIVDEIHALVGNKRGAHLALTLERLDALCQSGHGRRLQRIGLSATVEPAEEAASFLAGTDRPCRVVDTGRAKPLDLRIEVPKETLSAVASRTAWEDVHERVCALIAEHKTTLVFVPSRRMCERAARDLEAKLGAGAPTKVGGAEGAVSRFVAAHHGALARKTRHSVEKRLQRGELRAVVATASLELGIDIGDVELVIQLGSPRSIAVLRQRVGRACHAVSGTPKGRLFVLTRDDLLEAAATVRAIRSGKMDSPVVRKAPLDVLAQQLVAWCATSEQSEDELFARVRGAQPYATLPRDEFDQVLAMLADGVATRRGRAGAHLHHDRVGKRIKARRGARLAALTSAGAIPDKADYQVVEDGTEAVVGTLDEDFAIESMAGDIFQLGNTSWRIRRVEAGRVRVEDAHGLPPSIPFWNGEGLARTEELSGEVAQLREELAARITSDGKAAAQAWLEEACSVEPAGAEQAVAYVDEGVRALGVVPSQSTVVAERFFDESGGMQLVVHAPFGARINRAWGLALRKKFCRAFDFELQAAASDDAVLLSIGPQHSFPLDSIFGFVSPSTVEETVIQAALQSPLWGTRWRWNAVRSLAVLRAQGGRKTPPPILRMRAADLLAAVFPEATGCQDNHGGVLREDMALPKHPLVEETVRDCLEEAMDARGLERVLTALADGRLRAEARDTVAPSPFAHAILNGAPYTYLDDAPLEERRSRAVSTTRPGELDARDADLVTLDPEAIAAVVEEVHPDGPNGPRDADELHDLLCTAGLVAARPRLQATFAQLVAAGRASRLRRAGLDEHWVAAERLPLVHALYPDAQLDPPLDLLPGARILDGDEAVTALVGGLLGMSGPVTAQAIADTLGLDRSRVEIALAQLESQGRVLQGRFAAGETSASTPDLDVRWCERRLLQRIHRRTLGQLRERARPVAPAQLMRFLLRWQHAQPGTRLQGPEGLLRVIEQLEGIELPPVTWEREVLPARLHDYDPAWLDELCLSGEVAWARLRVEEPEPEEADRPRGSTGKIGLFLRAHASWLVDRPRSVDGVAQSPSAWPHLSPLARAVAAELEHRGAAFAADLATTLGQPAARIEDALWELVRTGAVTADGFSGLRALISSGPREGRPRRALSGRWSLLHRDAPPRPPVELDESGPFGDGSPVEHARLYLRRYGVITRTLLQRESAAPPWRELVQVYRRLEARGEIRGGRFVSGLTGEQFALPEAAEALRALRAPAFLEEVALPAVDPLNLVGILGPGARVPAIPSHTVIYHDGTPALSQRRLDRAHNAV